MNSITNTPNEFSQHKDTALIPTFDFEAFNTTVEGSHLNQLVKQGEPVEHEKLLAELLNEIEPINFQNTVFPETESLLSRKQELQSLTASEDKSKFLTERAELSAINSKLATQRVNQKQIIVAVVEEVLKRAKEKRWGLCTTKAFVFLFNGAFWKRLESEKLQFFLGKAAERLGVDHYTAEHFEFKKKLVEQFLTAGYLSSPKPPAELVLFNLQNGTFEFNAETSEKKLRGFCASDFLTHQLPFKFEPEATAPLFQKYLDRVLPEKEKQLVLAEYLSWVFIRHSSGRLKLEKALVLHGSGANGKSVFYLITQALFGADNFTTYNLQQLTDEKGMYRALIADKLVNYASEIGAKLSTEYFKQLVSGEKVQGRLLYSNAQEFDDYAKLIFNCNELPIVTSHNEAYFRRFLIIPFAVTIPVEERDNELHLKIIKSELAGVFNWVLAGLERLLAQKEFTYCESCTQAVEQYKRESDTVALFLEDQPLIASSEHTETLKAVYEKYRAHAIDSGNHPLNKNNVKRRLENLKFIVIRRNEGNVVLATFSKRTPPEVVF